MDRLLNRVVKSKDDCWEYIGCKLPNGYRKVGRKGVTWLAHRYAYAASVGAIPKGMLVLHKCDNRACVNPAHLFLGTHQDNTDDMLSKGRQDFSKLRTGPWKENLPRKISLEDRSEINRLRHECRMSLQEIAGKYGVTFQTIGKICAGRPRFRVGLHSQGAA